MAPKDPRKAEFGDFQTPPALADEVCARAEALFGRPRTILEPTCGVGGFLLAAQRRFGARTRLIGVEIHAAYLERAQAALAGVGRTDAALIHGDFFSLDWPELIADAKAPILVIGNPPWVTNSAIGALAGANLPAKSNAGKLRGLDAITGNSNFDVSEWIGTRILQELAGRDAAFALLLKTSVARKLLIHAWTNNLPLSNCAIHAIDARRHFAAAVDACLFVGQTHAFGEQACPTYADLGATRQTGLIGVDDGVLLADLRARDELAALRSKPGKASQWRSGIKHDCAKVLELRESAGALVNGLGEVVEIEAEHLYPLRKSSDVAHDLADVRRWLIVPQREIGEDTDRLEITAPRTWAYLRAHAERLDARKSSIYRGRPRFSIFGVGEYSFAPWKVAISGLYKQLDFRVVGPRAGRPVVFDDTVYFTPCADEAHARRQLALLESAPARRFLAAHIFWDAKRPITAGVLRRLSLDKLAVALSAASNPGAPSNP